MKRNGNLFLVVYILVSTLFFVISLKYSGAEAYHSTGILAYLKWSILSVLLNIGFLIQFLKPRGRVKILAIPFMLLAIIVNWLIYTNPKNFFTYDILSVAVMLMSMYLIVKGAFKNGKNLYA